VTNYKLQKGHLLIAEPSIIGDPSFNRSIILLADHTKEGSVGFIFNKPLEYTISDLIPDMTASFKVYNGGPVDQDNLYFIHTVPDLIPDSIEISHNIYWGGDFDFVIELMKNQRLRDTDIRFFLGYSGWENNQLQSELNADTWIVSENTYENKIIQKCCSTFWQQKMVEFGSDYSIWSNAPENPSYN